MSAASDDRMLVGIYLNDHLAGAVVGVNLARRLAASERSWAGDALDRLADEVAEDQAALLDMMSALDVPVRRYKTMAAWVGERTGRFKLNGRVFTRSPLSRIEELEAMRLAVEGKAAGWRTLRSLADSDPRLDPARLDRLNERARRQVDEFERLRVLAVAEVFGGDGDVRSDG